MGEDVQHRAVRRRRAHRHQRRHHRPGVRRPPGPGHHRGPHRARRRGGRRRDGPRRAHRRRAPRDRGLGVGPLGRRHHRRGRRVPGRRRPRRPAGRAAAVRARSSGSRARPARSWRSPSPSPSPSPSWPTPPSWPRSSAPSSPASPSSAADQADRIRRELAPVGHLFIPVFFLQIGIDADIGAFVSGAVLRDAGDPPRRRRRREARLAARRHRHRRATRCSSASACCPAARSGLIFATIGLQNGVLGDDLYAALLLVVLVTTLVTPQLLKIRYAQLRAAAAPASHARATRRRPTAAGSPSTATRSAWPARPPDELAVPLALDAAVPLARRRPSPELLDWLADAAPVARRGRRTLTSTLLDVIERGNARSWRFLETTACSTRPCPSWPRPSRRAGDDGVLARPARQPPLREHGAAADARRRRPARRVEIRQLEHVDRVLLAAFLVDALEDEPDPWRTARGLLDPPRPRRRGPRPRRARPRRATATCSGRRPTSPAASARSASLAAGRPPRHARAGPGALRARARCAPRAASAGSSQRLRELHDLVQAVLADDDARRQRGPEPRRAAPARGRPRCSPASPGALERLEPRAARLRAAHAVRRPWPATPGCSTRRRPRAAARAGRRRRTTGLVGRRGLAGPTRASWPPSPGARRASGSSVDDAVLATWPDGAVLDSFLVRADGAHRRRRRCARRDRGRADEPLASSPLPDAERRGRPAAPRRGTPCARCACTDRPGLLAALATAFAAAGIEVQVAPASPPTTGWSIDRFEVTDRAGAKLSGEQVDTFRAALRSGSSLRRRRLGRGLSGRSSPRRVAGRTGHAEDHRPLADRLELEAEGRDPRAGGG